MVRQIFEVRFFRHFKFFFFIFLADLVAKVDDLLGEIASIQEALTAQIALPGDQSCFTNVQTKSEASMEGALALQASVPSGDRQTDLDNIAILQTIVDDLKNSVALCGTLDVTTTTIPSKNFVDFCEKW